MSVPTRPARRFPARAVRGLLLTTGALAAGALTASVLAASAGAASVSGSPAREHVSIVCSRPAGKYPRVSCEGPGRGPRACPFTSTRVWWPIPYSCVQPLACPGCAGPTLMSPCLAYAGTFAKAGLPGATDAPGSAGVQPRLSHRFSPRLVCAGGFAAGTGRDEPRLPAA
jgi:hypothetical protein